jgi:hypothetical protein
MALTQKFPFAKGNYQENNCEIKAFHYLIFLNKLIALLS